jgi:hypothetical protein
MKIIGIPLRKPNSTEVTAAMVMGTGLWIACIGLLHAARFDMGRGEAGALLLVTAWGCLSARVGIRIGMGHRHLLANLLVSALLLAAYEGAGALL